MVVFFSSRRRHTRCSRDWSSDVCSSDLDYIDICLMHCLTEADWTDRFQPVMDVLSEAKQKGVIRAHGCSCHSIEALESAAKSPWVDVHLVRINPLGAYMDARPDTVVSVMREMRSNGQAIVGMKILGQGDRKSTRLNSSHGYISYAVFCLKKKMNASGCMIGTDC